MSYAKIATTRLVRLCEQQLDWLTSFRDELARQPEKAHADMYTELKESWKVCFGLIRLSNATCEDSVTVSASDCYYLGLNYSLDQKNEPTI